MRSLILTPEELKKNDILALIRELLSSEYTTLEVASLEIKDQPDQGTKVKFKLITSGKTLKKYLAAEGVGFVDALFLAFKDHYLSEYQSLAKISLSSFSVLADNYSSQTPEGTDGLVKVKVCFRDAHKKIIPFAGTSRSLSRAAALSIAAAFEYYINSEKCFFKLKELVKDAERRSRGDLRQAYISQLIRIVGVSSYEEISI